MPPNAAPADSEVPVSKHLVRRCGSNDLFARIVVPPFLTTDLGRMSYADALALQREKQQQVIASRDDDAASSESSMHLLLVEHDPVITVSRRKGAETHLVATNDQLSIAGVEVAETDRGGDITYHGPGQLVVYPIFDLNRLGLRVHSYMRFLEQIVIDTLSGFGLVGHRDACATGVWIGGGMIEDSGDGMGHIDDNPAAATCKAGFRGDRKICAMGVRVSRWVTMHGFALNVNPDMEHFKLIVPCGLPGRSITSLKQELGDDSPSMDDVKRVVAAKVLAEVESRL